jgi:hypothetical protein
MPTSTSLIPASTSLITEQSLGTAQLDALTARVTALENNQVATIQYIANLEALINNLNNAFTSLSNSLSGGIYTFVAVQLALNGTALQGTLPLPTAKRWVWVYVSASRYGDQNPLFTWGQVNIGGAPAQVNTTVGWPYAGSNVSGEASTYELRAEGVPGSVIDSANIIVPTVSGWGGSGGPLARGYAVGIASH